MFLEMNFRSKELKKNTQVNVIIPHSARNSATPVKTLWLLHGRSDDHTAWMRNTSIERLASYYGFAVVMPNVDRSWYTNTAYGMNYFNYITKELPSVCRSTFSCMSDKREYNLIGGLSMGGYGALKAALTYPENYSDCISLSGSVDVTRRGRPVDLEEWRSIFGFDLQSPLELEGSEHDLFALAQKVKDEGKIFPRFYLWCGLEDPLIVSNRLLDAHLTKLGADHYFEESEGDHSWKWWEIHIRNSLNWVLHDTV